MRTVEEIVAHVAELGHDIKDFFGFERADLIAYLTPEQARPFLKEEVNHTPQELNDEAVRAVIRDYLPFAIDKAEGHRGLSAGRSVSHLRAWFWLLGDDEMVAFIDGAGNYTNYGVPILKRAAEKVGYPWPSDEENEALNRMARGETCCVSCDEGCGQ